MTATRTIRIGVLWAIIVVLIGASTLMVQAPLASAGTPPTQSKMGDWSSGQVWKTSTKWGRVRDRVGFQWTTSAPYLVRAVSQIQVDWPNNCKVGGSVSVPPSASVSASDCKFPSLLASLQFNSITIPLSWSGPAGAAGHKTCELKNVGTGVTDVDSKTWTCVGDWMPEQENVYYQASAPSTVADVKDDGDGLKSLPPRSSRLHFYPR